MKPRGQFKDQPYKLELINNLEAGNVDDDGEPVDAPVQISFYKHGAFTDLCRGPHVQNTSEINPDALKLLSIAGAYWRGSEKNPMLQRIYGTAFEKAQDLEEYLVWREEVRETRSPQAGQAAGPVQHQS